MRTRQVDPTRIDVVHATFNLEKVDRLEESLLADGWVGRPLLICDRGDFFQALTGTHRLNAAQNVEMDLIPVNVITTKRLNQVAQARKVQIRDIVDDLVNCQNDTARLAKLAGYGLWEAAACLEDEIRANIADRTSGSHPSDICSDSS